MQNFSLKHDKQTIHYEAITNDSHSANILFLHGLASNATRWRELMQSTSLQQHANLYAMNIRGHGRSTTFKYFQRQHWCNDTRMFIQSLNKPTIIVGHSMGAQIALDYASQHPDDVRALVLIDPVFPHALSGLLAKVARLRWLLLVASKVVRLFSRLGIHKRAYPYRDLQKLDQDTRAFLSTNPDKSIADLYMSPLVDLQFIPLVNYLQDLYEVTRELPDLSTIQTPVLVLLSSGASTSHVDENKKILAKLPNLETKIIHADHWLLTEKPDEARDVIDSWCLQRLKQNHSAPNKKRP